MRSVRERIDGVSVVDAKGEGQDLGGCAMGAKG